MELFEQGSITQATPRSLDFISNLLSTKIKPQLLGLLTRGIYNYKKEPQEKLGEEKANCC